MHYQMVIFLLLTFSGSSVKYAIIVENCACYFLFLSSHKMQHTNATQFFFNSSYVIVSSP